jgi:hypothetical protein
MSPKTRLFFSVAALTLLLIATFPAVFAAPMQPTTHQTPGQYAINCTYTIGYWKTHPEAWPVASLTVGGVSYTQAQLLNILWTSPQGDATYIVAHQLIGAMLNVAQGADPSATGGTIAAANAWLSANPIGSDPGGSARGVGIGYSETLDSYNNGLIGPGHCGSNPPTSTSVPQPTPTLPTRPGPV